MAKATVKVKTRKTFTLRLSEREALAIAVVVANAVSMRSKAGSLGTDAIGVMNALENAGVEWYDHPANEGGKIKDADGNLVFSAYPAVADDEQEAA